LRRSQASSPSSFLAEHAGPAQSAAIGALDDLLAKVIDARERVRKNAGDSPVLLKIGRTSAQRARRRRAHRALSAASTA